MFQKIPSESFQTSALSPKRISQRLVPTGRTCSHHLQPIFVLNIYQQPQRSISSTTQPLQLCFAPPFGGTAPSITQLKREIKHRGVTLHCPLRCFFYSHTGETTLEDSIDGSISDKNHLRDVKTSKKIGDRRVVFKSWNCSRQQPLSCNVWRIHTSLLKLSQNRSKCQVQQRAGA